MPSTTILLAVGIYVLSFIVGIVFFYVMSHDEKATKKKLIDDALSMLISFIIFVWIGKGIVHFQLLFKDPLAVLAYPSDSRMFYIATVLLFINYLYLYLRGKIDLVRLLQAVLPVLLAASFTYEFLEIIVYHYERNWLYFIALIVLLFIYIFWRQRHDFIIFIIWLVVQFLLASLFSYTLLFGYMLSAWYFMSLIICASIIYFVYRKYNV